MGTRSRIGYVNSENGFITSAYCHWDGYPSNNGKILLENYTSTEKVRQLVDQGDMSSLGEKCTKPEGHTFDTPVDGYTTYYGRDRGETGVKAKTSVSKEKFVDLTEDSGGEYAYLFDDGKWYFIKIYGGKEFNRLTPAACTE